ncbi:MAG: flagellar motor protein MotB [Elusimicrobiota bacterium]|jgi:chemotaxis protein MotB
MAFELEKIHPINFQSRSQYIWLTIYSDLITNLFLLFLSLYALSFMGPAAMSDAVASMKNRLEYARKASPWYEDLAHSLKMVSNADAPIVAREDRLQMALPDEVLFAPGDGELRGQDQLVLHAIAQAIRRVPYTILIEGHTDNQPLRPGSRYASNWELSMARAMAVVRYLIRYEGLSPRRVGVAAYGEYHPRFPNDTLDHRTANRRIEISILRYE